RQKGQIEKQGSKLRGAGGRARNERRPPAPGPRARTTAPGASVWRQDPLRNAMPVARRDREKALPDAWWRSRIWRTQGATQRQLQAWPVHRRGDRLSEVGEAVHTQRESTD